MALPILHLFVGIDKDATLLGPGVSTLNLSSYTSLLFTCAALGISKASTNAAQLEVTGSGANALVHFLAADTTGKAPGDYECQLFAITGGKTFSLTRMTGTLKLRNPG